MPDRKRLWMAGLLMLICAPLLVAMTPNPVMEFEIIYEISPAPEITSAELFVCQAADCSDRTISDDESGFWCSDSGCQIEVVHNSPKNFQIQMEFSDQTSRMSNVFHKSHASSDYEIYVFEDDLSVVEVGGSNPAIFRNLFVIIVLIGSLIGGFIGVFWPILLAVVFIMIIIEVISERIENNKKIKEENLPEEEVKE